ncbi:MAG TPA: GGDEF domain-containing protein, partial [Alteromonas australica]|nr:GGDEF domain-containing protein [Alteromonas australica]
LTRCYNRRYLFDYLNEDFANPPLAENYSLIMVDIDHFKAINDTYGHTAGDKVLEEIAAILTHTVDDTGIVTRYGGEEFCIVLPTSTINSAIDIAHTIKNKVSTYKHGDIEVTCSIGVSSMAFTANTPSELIEQADAALFHSKHKGRNSVTSWNEIAP